jgi:septal ring factor EnvC (AmiA/AmiB activator)
MLKRIATAVFNFLGQTPTVGGIISAVLVVMCLVLAGIQFRSCFQNPSNTVDAEQQQILDTVERKRAATAKKFDLLEAELTDLQEQILALDESIRASVTEREATHDQIDSALTIDRIDDILRVKNNRPRGGGKK